MRGIDLWDSVQWLNDWSVNGTLFEITGMNWITTFHSHNHFLRKTSQIVIIDSTPAIGLFSPLLMLIDLIGHENSNWLFRPNLTTHRFQHIGNIQNQFSLPMSVERQRCRLWRQFINHAGRNNRQGTYLVSLRSDWERHHFERWRQSHGARLPQKE